MPYEEWQDCWDSQLQNKTFELVLLSSWQLVLDVLSSLHFHSHVKVKPMGLGDTWVHGARRILDDDEVDGLSSHCGLEQSHFHKPCCCLSLLPFA
jgi:hypothetical protein